MNQRKYMSVSRDHNTIRTDREQFSRTSGTFLSRELMSKFKFVVVGAGALGNEAVKALGLLGAGSVLVIDPDRVELSNLSRSIFFRPADQLKNKAETLARAACATFPHTSWDFCNAEIADVGLAKVAGANLILSCVDNDLARIEIAWLALRLNLPVSDAGLGGPDYWRGRVSFFPGRGAACFCCKLSPQRRREVLTTAQSRGNSCWAETVIPVLPSTPTMAAIFGALQVDFGLRCLLDLQHAPAGSFEALTIELRLDQHPELTRFVTHITPQCPLHGPAQQPEAQLPHPHATARELLDAHGAEAIDLDWPICVAARCTKCHKDWQPMRRVAWLRRFGACPDCGSRHILENENLGDLDRRSIWADVPLIHLGLPSDHLYAVR
jgi:adenylyltransferase/sulfurtransferase